MYNNMTMVLQLFFFFLRFIYSFIWKAEWGRERKGEILHLVVHLLKSLIAGTEPGGSQESGTPSRSLTAVAKTRVPGLHPLPPTMLMSGKLDPKEAGPNPRHSSMGWGEPKLWLLNSLQHKTFPKHTFLNFIPSVTERMFQVLSPPSLLEKAQPYIW